VHPSDGRRLKINEIDDQLRKRYANHRWVDHEEEEDQGYVWQKGQWCPPGLRRSQKRRVQHLRNQELKEAGIKKRQVWQPKDKPDESGRSALHAWYVSCRMNSWIQLIKLCRRRIVRCG
jgi:hypothetical protein